MDGLLAAQLIDVARMGLQQVFRTMRMAGKTEEQMKALFDEEYSKFLINDPDNLADPT